MSIKVKEILYATTVFLVLVASLFTGREQSPLRYLYIPLIIFLAMKIKLPMLIGAGSAFSALFALMAFYTNTPNRELPELVAEVLSFFLLTVCAGFLVRNMEIEKLRSSKAVATFQGISEDLKQKSHELQTALGALTKAHRQMQDSNRIRNSFLANVSHELRTPLTSIRCYSEMLLDYDDIDNATKTEFIRTINEESERMTLLVNKNLDLIRLEAGKSEMDVTSVNPLLLIDISLKVVAPMAEKKGIPISADIPGDIPAVRGDQNLITQVLVNLLNNAVKFTEAGTIIAGARRKEKMVEFFVTDTGEGIFPEEKEVIFDEFYRISENLPERPTGSGLGLTIAKQIVVQHDGRIWVDSVPGKGSTFYFTIPVFKEEAAYIPSEPIHEKGEVSLQYEPILVQSESIVVRQTLRKYLEHLGYMTIGADTPKRGGEISTEIRPRLIISDNLEDDTAFAKMGNWAQDAGVRIILATFYINPLSGELGLVASGYLKRPFDRFQIAATVEGFVKHNGRFVIVSPNWDEARKLQASLGAEGYTSALFMDETEALKAIRLSPSDGIIIGSFPKPRMEDVVSAMMKDQLCRSLPFFLVLGEGCTRFASAVTVDHASRRNDGKGLSPLIAMIDNSNAGMR
jgi:signal transduction histidine kinase